MLFRDYSLDHLSDVINIDTQGKNCVFAFDLDDVIIQTDLENYDEKSIPIQKYVDVQFPKKLEELKIKYPRAHFIVVTKTPQAALTVKLAQMETKLQFKKEWFSDYLATEGDKGDCLKHYFNDKKLKPNHIVMIDDFAENLSSVCEYGTGNSIPVTTVQFMASIDNLMEYRRISEKQKDISALLTFSPKSEIYREQYDQLQRAIGFH